MLLRTTYLLLKSSSNPSLQLKQDLRPLVYLEIRLFRKFPRQFLIMFLDLQIFMVHAVITSKTVETLVLDSISHTQERTCISVSVNMLWDLL
jgi:hypothetical protein